MANKNCESCKGEGWLLSDNGKRMTIERCDTCKRFNSDSDATVAVVNRLRACELELQEIGEQDV